MKPRLIVASFICASMALHAVATLRAEDTASMGGLRSRLQAITPQSGFRMTGYWVWCGSIIRVDGEYQLFASRWPKRRGFPDGYRTDSEIVRATSRSLLGPYAFQEVVIGKRSGDYWDSQMAHNPTIHKIGNSYVLYYIGSDYRTKQPGRPDLVRRIGYATADSIRGPWHRIDLPIVSGDANNPAVYVETDGRVKMMYRNADLRVSVAAAARFDGAYSIISENAWPGGRLEDFFLYSVDGVENMICEDNLGAVTGHERWGAHFECLNGFGTLKKARDLIAYDHAIACTDGTVIKCVRRERPQLLIEDGAITALVTAVYNGEDSWSQPVPISPSIRDAR